MIEILLIKEFFNLIGLEHILVNNLKFYVKLICFVNKWIFSYKQKFRKLHISTIKFKYGKLLIKPKLKIPYLIFPSIFSIFYQHTWWSVLIWSSHRRCSVKKRCSWEFCNIHRKHRRWSLFLIKRTYFRNTFFNRTPLGDSFWICVERSIGEACLSFICL